MVGIFMFIVTSIVALSAMILPTALVLGITMPFQGTLIRYRANYTPKRVQLPGEADGAEDRSINSYFGMMKRVHRIEGWAGLYKGFMPSIIANFVTIILLTPVIAFLAFGHRMLPGGRVSLPPTTSFVMSMLSYGLSIVPALLLIPAQIMINRTITTPHKLSAFAPADALRVLLSPTERANPLRLYLAPGLALSELLPAVVVPSVTLAWQLAVPHIPRVAWRFPTLAIGLPMVLMLSALLAPLQVMNARLTLQRQGEEAEVEVEAGREEVMEFREGRGLAPYTGLVNCARQIVAEEGVRALFRAWWVTALGLGATLILSMVQLESVY